MFPEHNHRIAIAPQRHKGHEDRTMKRAMTKTVSLTGDLPVSLAKILAGFASQIAAGDVMIYLWPK
jgi:hypothetical protein